MSSDSADRTRSRCPGVASPMTPRPVGPRSRACARSIPSVSGRSPTAVGPGSIARTLPSPATSERPDPAAHRGPGQRPSRRRDRPAGLPDAEVLTADKRSDSDRFRHPLSGLDIEPCIPGRANRKPRPLGPERDDPISHRLGEARGCFRPLASARKEMGQEPGMYARACYGHQFERAAGRPDLSAMETVLCHVGFPRSGLSISQSGKVAASVQFASSCGTARRSLGLVNCHASAW